MVLVLDSVPACMRVHDSMVNSPPKCLRRLNAAVVNMGVDKAICRMGENECYHVNKNIGSILERYLGF